MKCMAEVKSERTFHKSSQNESESEKLKSVSLEMKKDVKLSVEEVKSERAFHDLVISS